jgi:hypothetical protein
VIAEQEALRPRQRNWFSIVVIILLALILAFMFYIVFIGTR